LVGLSFNPSLCVQDGIFQNQLFDRIILQTLQTLNIDWLSYTISISVELQEGHLSLTFILIAF
jgi:hypothetical protein